MVLGKLDIHIQKNEVGSQLYTIYRVNSKWIKDLNKTAKTLKPIRENKGVNFITLD
jgi:hypothetical protein